MVRATHRRANMLVLVLASILVLLAALAGAAFVRDMRAAYGRLEGRSQLIETPEGALEYAEGGSGTPVLVIHGSGGGFDQGALLARSVLDDRFRWIAPSRFGYLRSVIPPGATFDDQARAYVRLLDHLGLDRVAVVALSHGGPSALLLAAHHPQRVSSLTLISAGVAASATDADAAQQQSDRQGAWLMRIYQHDIAYWSLTQALRTTFLRLMGVDGAVSANLTPAQRALADEVIDGMNPVQPRAAGAVFDHHARMPEPRALATIRAPTLVFHARDDSLQRFRHAEIAVATIAGAQLQAYERGGHLLLAVEQPAIRARVAAHILEHAGTASVRP